MALIKKKSFLYGIWPVFEKECIHIIRSWQVRLLSLVMTAVEIVLIGIAIDTNVRQVPMVVYDMSNSQESREMIKSFLNTDTFLLVKQAYSDKEIYDTVVSGEARVALKIPSDYSRRVAEGNANILVLTDGSNSIITTAALAAADGVAAQQSIKLTLAKSLVPSEQVNVEARQIILFNPNTYTPNFIIPGLVALHVQSIALMMAAGAVAREKERGTIDQLYLTPAKPLGIIIGKLLPYGALGIVQQTIVLVMSYFVLDLTIQGSYFLLLFLTLPFLWVCLAIGALISVTTDTLMAANQIAIALDLFSLFLGGVFFEITSMPKAFQWIASLIPTTHYINITRGIMVRGAGFEHLWYSALVMFSLGTIAMLIAAWRFKKQQSV
ncbi:MAG: antibiotic transport system permease protein [bacterium]|nr:MAG: antibiotic transport system permease protein [bacterium]